MSRSCALGSHECREYTLSEEIGLEEALGNEGDAGPRFGTRCDDGEDGIALWEDLGLLEASSKPDHGYPELGV